LRMIFSENRFALFRIMRQSPRLVHTSAMAAVGSRGEDLPMSARRLSGQCFCGAVAYTVRDAFVYAANCHCSNCRRTTGSAFKPFAGIARDKLTLTKGHADLMIFGDEEGNDTHCGKCGSLLYSVVREGRFVHVAMGTLVDDPSIRPTRHIFVGSKASWFSITDDLPQYDGHAPA